MRIVLAVLFIVTLIATQVYSADKCGNECTDNKWYTGDEHCPTPKNDGMYSAPYNAKDHNEYPTFSEADKPGWSCSYQREDGVFIQYGNSLTPQQQWMSIRGGIGD
jgi:hypothetical protein